MILSSRFHWASILFQRHWTAFITSQLAQCPQWGATSVHGITVFFSILNSTSHRHHSKKPFFPQAVTSPGFCTLFLLLTGLPPPLPSRLAHVALLKCQKLFCPPPASLWPPPAPLWVGFSKQTTPPLHFDLWTSLKWRHLAPSHPALPLVLDPLCRGQQWGASQ